MKNNFEIQKGTPPPKLPSNRDEPFYKKMEVGDWANIGNDNKTRCSVMTQASTWGKKLESPRKFKSHLSKDGFILTRIK